ncbi:hypothetical protein [Shewanella sp. YLB-07]|uniref:hypothetical protein n=1 Tax=Shewanella sp. YLB-07 TaxID=2601268 RepID=UPI0012C56AC9|nr:hypothetical protein [Shewanella sp. YLB-07]MPY23923.1 hypothetical protein [Shewanella sp. YLB-07]
MRNLTLIGAATVCSLGAWWFTRSTKTTPVTVNSVPNTDFNAVLFPWENTATSSTQPNTGSTMRMPRGLANNNPLNIRENDRVDYDWLGESIVDNDESFEVFDTPFYGIRAAARILKTYRDKRGLNTVEGIINRWAPTHENPTPEYANFVANRAGVSVQQPLSMADYPKVIGAMIHFENGYNPYDETLINSATAQGLA